MRLAMLLAVTLLTALFAATASAQPDASRRAVPEGVQATRDVVYGTVNGRDLLLDLYLPEKADGPLPLIVWIHGGGWSGGSKANCPAARLASRGYAIASIGYRLSGEATFPAQIQDCKAAIRFLRANAAKYNINPDRIGAWGSSAGGHLAAMLGTTGDVKEFDVGDHLNVSSRVQAVCDFFGPSDLLKMQEQSGPDSRIRHDAPGSPESRLIGGTLPDHPDRAKAASPITYVTPDDPPFFIAHGDDDQLVPVGQSDLLYAALGKAGVPVHLHIIEGAGHGNGFGGREFNMMVLNHFERALKRGEKLDPKPQRTSSKAEGNTGTAQREGQP